MDNLDFKAYHVQFERAALQHHGIIRRIEHGGSIATFGKGKRIALMSGLHGDEQSGPLGILAWLKETASTKLVPEGYQLWIAPLVNNDGWDNNRREWNALDLNRSFNAAAPSFLKGIMESLAENVPYVFLDLHEDSDRPELYVYHYLRDDHGADVELARVLGANIVDWNNLAPWEGSSEVFVRQLGCSKCITLEIPPTWPLEKRIDSVRRSIEWFVGRPTAF